LLVEKIGPGSYRPTYEAEFGKFHREVSALMPRRGEGHKPRAIIDTRTLHIRKGKKKTAALAEVDDSKAHLGKFNLSLV
jgi:hypothetical protein